jgi:hypothetical protein
MAARLLSQEISANIDVQLRVVVLPSACFAAPDRFRRVIG